MDPATSHRSPVRDDTGGRGSAALLQKGTPPPPVCVSVFRSEGAHFIVCVFVCVSVFRSEGSHFIVCVFVCLSVFRSEGSQL